jgi:hypothetical protein
MRRRLALAALAAPALLLAAAPATSPAAAASRQDWGKVVTMTPSGGFRIGNPAAPVKLVEYGSMTCPHCAQFAQQAYSKLVAGPVRTGRVSYEFRNLVLNPYDMAASLLARCTGTGGFFPLTDQFFRTQAQWTGRFGSMTPAQFDALNALPEHQRLARIAEIGGLTQAGARFGLTPQKASACLRDPGGLARLVELRRLAMEVDKVQGTPSFLLNGRLLEGVGDWQSLEPRLRQAGG